jgi:hypothetical protein
MQSTIIQIDHTLNHNHLHNHNHTHNHTRNHNLNNHNLNHNHNNHTCCICLDYLDKNDSLFITNCCKNKLHKCCVSTWFLYKADFICPLCNSKKIRMNITEIKTYKKFLTPNYITNITKLEQLYHNKQSISNPYLLILLYIFLITMITSVYQNYNSF